MVRNKLLVFLFLFCLSCNQTDKDCITAFNKAIGDDLDQVINLGDKLDCVSWDSLLILPPYMTNTELVKNKTGITLNYTNDGDKYYFLYLIKNKTVNSLLKIERVDIDFGVSFKNNKEDFLLIDRSNCLFKIYDSGKVFSNGKSLTDALLIEDN